MQLDKPCSGIGNSCLIVLNERFGLQGFRRTLQLVQGERIDGRFLFQCCYGRVGPVSLGLSGGGTDPYLIYRKRMGKDEAWDEKSKLRAYGGHDGFQDCRAEGSCRFSAERKAARSSLGSLWARRCLFEARSSDRQLGSYAVVPSPRSSASRQCLG